MLRILLLLLTFSVSLRAHNNVFLPGDAFFTTLVTLEELEQWREGPLTMHYHRLHDVSYFCGYLGYSEAVITGLTKDMVTSLITALKKLDEEGRGFVEGERDGKKIRFFRVFIYNRETDLKSARIGLRYNEQWAALQRTHKPKEPVFYDEIGGAAAVIENWRSAEVVGALKFSATKTLAEANHGESLKMSLAAEGLKFVVCQNKDLIPYTELSEDLAWYEVTEKFLVYTRPKGEFDHGF